MKVDAMVPYKASQGVPTEVFCAISGCPQYGATGHHHHLLQTAVRAIPCFCGPTWPNVPSVWP